MSEDHEYRKPKVKQGVAHDELERLQSQVDRYLIKKSHTEEPDCYLNCSGSPDELQQSIDYRPDDYEIDQISPSKLFQELY